MSLLPMQAYSEFKDTRVDAHHAIDRIHAMAQQEQHYSSSEYFRDISFEPVSLSIKTDFLSQPRADVHSRIKMCAWCYQVVDFFMFSRETVQISMSYFDRFLATPQGRLYLEDQFSFQLACIACMYVAIKVNDPMELDASLLCQLSRGFYSVAQITQTERVILQALQWRLNPPTATAFVQHIVALLTSSFSSDDRKPLLHVSMYQAELAIFDYRLVMAHTASTIAAAAVLNAMECTEISTRMCSLSVKKDFSKTMHTVLGRTPDMEGAIQDCRTQMLRCVHESPIETSSIPRPKISLVGDKCADKNFEREEQLTIAINQ